MSTKSSSSYNSSKKDSRLIGYPIIEKLLKTEDFKAVDQSISKAYETLERMLKTKGLGMSKQKAIKQALKAYDLTIELLRTLLKTKQDMIQEHNKNNNLQNKTTR